MNHWCHLVLGMLFSVIFLLITFLVYAIIPELRNLNGKFLMSYVVSLAFSFVLLSIINSPTLARKGKITLGVTCKTFGYLFYVCMLSSFFWLNAMSFNIWKTITGGLHNANRPNNELKRYFMYACYAYGVPILILCFALFMDYADGIPNALRPNIGNDSCFLSGTYE